MRIILSAAVIAFTRATMLSKKSMFIDGETDLSQAN
jgi:hypothetical protein